ncbi:MAG TPA: NADH-quinone oxidoreductase subunit J [Bacteroidota bacterium]|jgi:NADH-quinone oxidoreductase subunit J|nr:NADH-quinone oxidoreductase subunit J [Bacteroidota bacterium]
MTLYDIVFYFFAVITVISGATVVMSKNIIYSAFSLLFTFFGVAGLYVLLNADFLAVTQLLIYVGGILVLLLFGVMLTNKVINVDMKTGVMQTWPGAIVCGMTTGALVVIFMATDWNIVREEVTMTSTTHTLGEMFMTSYLLPFEIASVVLLVALVGAAMIARKDTKSEA